MNQNAQIASLNVIRGIAVILMIITHIWITFFWNNNSPIGSTLSFIGGYLSFTIFLFISGFLLGNLYKEVKAIKIIIRAALIVLVYIGLGSVYVYTHSLSLGYVFTSPVFLQEYLLTLAIMPIFGYILLCITRPLEVITRVIKHPFGIVIIFVVGVLLVLAGKYTATLSYPGLPFQLLFGSTTQHFFPIISYGIVYISGSWLGWAKREDSQKDFKRELYLIIAISAAITCLAVPLENISISINTLDNLRWPPTVFFIFSSLSIGTVILLLCLFLEKFSQNFIMKFLSFLGKNSLILVVIHLLIIFIAEPYVLGAKTFQPFSNQAPVINVDTSPDETFFTSIEKYSDDNKWPYKEERVAIIQSQTIIPVGNSAIQVYPEKIGSSMSGNDVNVYQESLDGSFKDLDFSIVLNNQRHYYIYFNVLEDTKNIIIGYNQKPQIPAIPDLDTGLKRSLPDKTNILQVLDQDFKGWAYRSLSLQGTSWIIVATNLNRNNNYRVYLPFSCNSLSVFLEGKGDIDFLLGDKILEHSVCENIPQVKKDLTSAQSIVTLTIDTSNIQMIKEVAELNISILFKLGEKEVVLAVNKQIAISSPMYIIWSLDWEGFSVPQAHMETIERIRNEQKMRIVHLLNPRVWNSSAVSTGSANNQIAFVKDKMNRYDDEVGMHMHMFKDMVEKAGVIPSTITGWSNRPDGYDVPLTEYSYEDSKKLFSWGVAEFVRKGFPKPITFRAGGWFIDMENIKALRDTGFLVDTSGRTKYNSRGFGSGTAVQGPWSLSDTQSPYWISKNSQNAAANSKSLGIGILEMPNNGVDSWAFSEEQLLDRFKKNYTEMILQNERMLVYLSHPEYMNKEGPKIEKVLRYIKYFTYDGDSGPVIYTTFKEYYNLFSK